MIPTQQTHSAGQNEAFLRLASRIGNLGAWTLDAADWTFAWSDEVCAMHETPPGFKPAMETFLGFCAPEFRQTIRDALESCVREGTPFDVEFQIITASGRRVWVRQIGEAERDDASGMICRVQGMLQDIEERRSAEERLRAADEEAAACKRLELELARSAQALQMLSRCNEALIRAESETSLLNAICEIAVEVGGFVMAAAAYAFEDERKTIAFQTHAGAETSYFSDLQLSWAEDCASGNGPSARVIRSGQPVIIPDLAAEESFRPWAEGAQVRGFRGLISLPLRGVARTLGVLVFYLAEVRTLHPEELHRLQVLADDVAFGIVTLRSRAEQRRTHDAVLAIAQGLSASMGAEFFEKLARSLVEALDAHAGFIAQFTSPDHSIARTLCALVAGEIQPNFDYTIAGTPGEDLSDGNVRIVPRDLLRLYPQSHFIIEMQSEGFAGMQLVNGSGEPIGLMFVFFKEPLDRQEIVSSTLRIFASRAASELERQKADAKVREQASLLDKAQDAILVCGLDHHITYWNQSAERLYGWSAAEALGQSVKKLLSHDASVFDEAMRELLAEGDWSGELQLAAKDGRKLMIEGRWTLVRDEDGTPCSVLAINTDITERRKLEQQFLRAQRMESIGTLASGIAHDLNNVLAPIMMGVGLLSAGETDPWRAQILSTIETSADRGAAMVRQVLSFARGEECQRLEVKVKDLVKDIITIARDTFRKNIRIRTMIPNDVWSIMGDSTQLHQVLLNLCVNARDAMPDGGTLNISAENVTLDSQAVDIGAKPGAYIRILVEDSGLGMSQATMDKIFDPFFTTKELSKGTGLGLSTSLSIVKNHGGFIRVESEPKKGTRFAVYVPARTKQHRASESSKEPELPRGNGELILVADDEASVREMTQQTLQSFGYRVILACDGAEAVAACTRHGTEVAVVLTDMMMPVLDGPSAIQVLMRLNPRLSFIAASGISNSHHVARVESLGVRHFLPKPYTAHELLKVLREVLGSKNDLSLSY